MICMTDHQSHEHSQHDHADHGSHGGHAHGGGDGGDEHPTTGVVVARSDRLFYMSLIVTVPILIVSPMIQGFIGVDWRFSNDEYILFALATFIFFYGGWPFITGAFDELKDKNPGMMTLIGLAILVAYV